MEFNSSDSHILSQSWVYCDTQSHSRPPTGYQTRDTGLCRGSAPSPWSPTGTACRGTRSPWQPATGPAGMPNCKMKREREKERERGGVCVCVCECSIEVCACVCLKKKIKNTLSYHSSSACIDSRELIL